MKKLTVFTPTYNRAYCLENLYWSLCKQTNQNFQWLIVDDGSTDETAKLISRFIGENIIDIKYHYQTNSGKHVAHNKGVELCESELFVCVDSDDTLTKDAVQIILDKYEAHNREDILGLYLRRRTLDGQAMASAYPQGIERIGIMDLYHRYNFKGDTVIVLKTERIKNYSFPIFRNEKFVTERVLYNQLNDIAPMILCEDLIYCGEYLPDGYTKNTRRLTARNPYGTAVDCLFEAYYSIKLLTKVKYYAQYNAVVKIFDLDKKVLRQYNKNNFFIKIFALGLVPHYKKLYMELKKEFTF